MIFHSLPRRDAIYRVSIIDCHTDFFSFGKTTERKLVEFKVATPLSSNSQTLLAVKPRKAQEHEEGPAEELKDFEPDSKQA